MARVLIIGGGIIGHTCAWYAAKAGHRVLVVDAGTGEEGCSHGNAGILCPSHVVPLASPGMVGKGLRWMFQPKSPFHVRPRLDPDLWQWGWWFARACRRSHVLKAREPLARFSQYSQQATEALLEEAGIEAGYQQQGLTMLFRSEKGRKAEQADAAEARAAGLSVEEWDAAEVGRREPEVELDVLGAIHYPGDSQLDPGQFLRQLRERLITNGVHFRWSCAVQGFVQEQGKVVGVRTAEGDLSADQVIICAGSWSGQLARKLDVTLPLQAGKGYHLQVNPAPMAVRYPYILSERKISITPIGTALRVSGTMELDGLDERIREVRLAGIREGAVEYLPQLDADALETATTWAGLRPCSPDGLPYLGRLGSHRNVLVATGHAMLGVSLAAGSGRVIADLLEGRQPAIDLSLFRPERYQDRLGSVRIER